MFTAKRTLLLVGLFAAALSGCNSARSNPNSAAPSPAASATPRPTTQPIPEVRLLGEPELVFDASEQSCQETTAPDLPVRPFRDADGLINLNLSSATNYRMVGPDFDSLTVDCNPTLVSDFNPDPSQFNFSEWIGAVYTTDGQTVSAIVHNEYYGDIGAEWDSLRDFDDTQPSEHWQYLGWDGSSYRPMNFDQANHRWQGFLPLCQISNWGMHPDTSCQPTLQWTSPIADTVTVYGRVRDDAPEQGNGVTARILLNNQELWSQVIEAGDGSEYSFELEVDVAIGDPIRFQVDAGGDASFDSTYFRAHIDTDGNKCPSNDRNQCLMASLTAAQSTDGGQTFHDLEGQDHYIASAPRKYQPDWGSFNRWQPSKIVQNPADEYYYALVHRIDDPAGSDQNVYAACAMRSPDPADPTSWRAWDGQGFNLKFTNPYQESGDEGEAEQCQPVSRRDLTYDLTYNSYLEKFVAVGHVSGGVETTGFYFMVSDDMVNWSSIYLLMEADFSYTTSEGPYLAYPSLVDHNSPSRTFATTGQTPYLYFSRFNQRTISDVDLLRVPVEFSLNE